MAADTYSFSFTTGSLFFQESVEVATLFLRLRNWTSVRDAVLTDNLLHFKTTNSLKRVYREVASRLKLLCEAELNLLVCGTAQEQAHVLWIAVCRRYQLIADFAREVVRERYINFKTTLDHGDFDVFFNRKAEWHSELDRVADTTRVKGRQIVFKMLKEVGLLTFDCYINSTILSARLLQSLPAQRREDVFWFPVSPVDLRRWA